MQSRRKRLRVCVDVLEPRVFLHAGDVQDFDVATVVEPAVIGTPADVLRVDVGGQGMTAADGLTFTADAGFVGGKPVRGKFAVANTEDDLLFSSRRMGNFTFAAPVPNGTYELSLAFVGTAKKAGRQLFNIDAEGQRIEGGLDIAAHVPRRTALVTDYRIAVSDGTLDLAITGVKGKPVLSGLALTPVVAEPTPIPAPEPTPTPTPAPTPTPTPTPSPTPTDTFTTVTWTGRADAPIVRAEALRGVVDGKLYVFGGFSGDEGPVTHSDVYDPAADKWTQIADLPRRLTHAGVVAVDRDVYFAGGYIGTGPGFQQQFGTAEVWRYDSVGNAYSRLPDLLAARGGGALVAVGRVLHFIAGNNSSRLDVADHYVLNLDDLPAGWGTRAALPGVGRSHMGYVNLNGKIYVTGGQTGNDEGLSTTATAYVYDPATDAWTQFASMPKAVSHISSSTFVMGGRIVVAGGETAHNAATSSVFAYDPATDQWTSLTSLPAPRFSGVAGAIGELIYFTGGSSTRTTSLGTPG